MADKRKQMTPKQMNSMLGDINDKMNSLYRDTYHSDISNKRDLDGITRDIEDNISQIINRNGETDIANISKLYSRMKLKNATSDKDFQNSVVDLFSDTSVTNSILSTYTENKWVRDLDNEIDTVCRYMPTLEEALKAKMDAVLTSDCFNKEYLNVDTLSATDEKQAIVSTNVEKIKKDYDLENFLRECYYDTAKYGEEFIYCVPYNRVFATLLNNKNLLNKSIRSTTDLYSESYIVENNVIIDDEAYKLAESALGLDASKCTSLKVVFDKSKVLKSAIDGNSKIAKLAESGFCESAINAFAEQANAISEAKGKPSLDTIFKDGQLEVPDFSDDSANDGFILDTKEVKPNQLKVPGAVLKTLKHENIIPIYIDNTCLGYYYLEFSNGDGYDLYKNMMDTYSSVSYGTPLTRATSDVSAKSKKDNMIAYLSGQLAENIDKQFINANIDLKKEIYSILQNNDIFNNVQTAGAIRVTYLSPEDVIHMKFMEDKDTHRGISDLLKGLIPAKLYACLYITNTIGTLTRGQDKRVYYVKQNVEQNIAQTMMNTIVQIKKNNFGIRQIENMNSILNITGRFNDFVIPVGPSGDAPISFEVMQGQEFNPNTDLMEQLENMAINSTGIPIDFLNTRQSPDFATQITSTNAKVLREVYTRQAMCEYFFSKILNKIYFCEYGENLDLKVILPTPMFLMLTNMSQLLDNIRTYAEAIANFEYFGNGDDVEDKKSMFIRKVMRSKLASYIKIDEIDRIKTMVDLEYIENKKNEDESGM